jgi:hypothetical protein
VGCGVEIMRKRSKDLISGGAGMAFVGGVLGNSVVSSAGAGLVVLGVMDSALNNKKGVKFKR